MTPKITVVTITYNCANFLQATLDSVFEQDYPNVEYIVVDGASSDGTLDMIKANSDRITRYVSEPDGGIYDAMNKGIAIATGDYINFMNAGDTFYSKTSISDCFAVADKSADIICADALYVTSAGEYVYRARPIESSKSQMTISHQATFIRTSLHKEMPYDTSYRLAGDLDFFYKAYKKGFKYNYIRVIAARFDAEGGQSFNNYRKVYSEMARLFGLDRKFGWKIRFELGYAWYLIRQWTKAAMPSSMVMKIRRFQQGRSVKQMEKSI